MSIAIARPALGLDGTSVFASPWVAGLASGDAAAGDLQAWDARTPVRVRRTVRLDPVLAARQLGYGDTLPELLLVVRHGTGSGRLPRNLEPLFRCPLDGTRLLAIIDRNVAPEMLSGQLWLQTDIVLAAGRTDGGPLSPRSAGTRLWSESWSVALESGVERFPTEIGRFSTLFPTKAWCHAPWCLRWYSGDPEQDLAAALRLYINADREQHCERIMALDPVALEPVMADVMEQLIVRAGLDDEIPGEEGWPAGSVGEQALRWRELAFPQIGAAAVRDMLAHRPGEFRASVLAAAELAGSGT